MWLQQGNIIKIISSIKLMFKKSIYMYAGMFLRYFLFKLKLKYYLIIFTFYVNNYINIVL